MRFLFPHIERSTTGMFSFGFTAAAAEIDLHGVYIVLESWAYRSYWAGGGAEGAAATKRYNMHGVLFYIMLSSSGFDTDRSLICKNRHTSCLLWTEVYDSLFQITSVDSLLYKLCYLRLQEGMVWLRFVCGFICMFACVCMQLKMDQAI